MMTVTVKSFNSDADKLSNEINSAIKEIDSDIKEQKKQYNINLFSDSDRYSDILFKEQINAKTELSKLTTELNNQRKRYQ